MQEPEFFTIAEVARMLKVSPDTVSRRFEHEPALLTSDCPNAVTRGAIVCSGFPPLL